MLGAHKLKIEQVKEIKKLFVQNLNDSEIAKMYGVSRPMINLIRNGNRWPEEKEKVKSQIEEVEDLGYICERVTINSNMMYDIESSICPIITPNGKLYIILHYLQDRLTSERFSGLFNEIPTDTDLQINHDKFKNKIW